LNGLLDHIREPGLLAAPEYFKNASIIQESDGGGNLLEKIYEFYTGNEKTIERIVNDENIHLNHMVFKEGEGFPEHYSNSNVYMIVARGTVSLSLAEHGAIEYERGSIINIPYNVKMNGMNKHGETLELFIVKAPNPKDYVPKKDEMKA